MPISVACECGQTYKVGEANAGKKFRCKKCETVLKVPAPKAEPEPAEEFDDFDDLGDDFGGDDFGGDDFGAADDYPAEPARPKKKSSSGKKSKSGGKKSSKKKGSKKGSKEMAPALKYSIAGGIVFVTTAVIVGILVARGVGGKKSNAGGGNNVAANDNAEAGDPAGDPANVGGDPGGGNPNGDGNPSGEKKPGEENNSLQWKPYSNPAGRFSILMPGQPEQKTKDVPTANGVRSSTAYGLTIEDGREFGVVITEQPAGPDYSDLAIAKRAFNQISTGHALAFRGGTTTRIPLKIGDHHGGEFKVNGAGVKMLVRVFLVGNRLYQVVAVWRPKDKEGPADAEKYVQSFKVQGMTAVAVSPEKKKTPGDSTAGMPTGKHEPPTVATKTAVQLLSENPPGNRGAFGKRFRVTSTIITGLNMGWIYIKGDGQRTVACKFEPVPRTPLNVGQTVTVEGELARNEQKYVSLIKCRLVATPKAQSKRPTSESDTNESDSTKAGGKFPLVLSNGRARFAKNNYLMLIDYKFVKGSPDPNGWYFITTTLPGNRPNYLPRQGKDLQKQGTLRLRAPAKSGQPTTGEISATVYFGKTRQRTAGKPIAETLKFKVGQSAKSTESPGAASGRRVRSWKHNVSTREEKNSVTTLAFSPDGSKLAAGGRDGMVKLWDPRTGRNVATWKGHTGMLRCVVFNPKGTMIASAGEDKLIRVWDVKSGHTTATLKGHEESVESLAFSRDGKTLASVASDSVIMWNATNGGRIGKLGDAGGAPTSSIVFNSDGKTLATGDFEGTVKLWNVATRKPQAVLTKRGKGFSTPVQSLAFSPDGTTLAAGQSNDKVIFWDVKTRKSWTTHVRARRGERVVDMISGLAFSADGRTIATVSAEPGVKLWDVKTGRQIGHLKSSSTLFCVAFSPDGKSLAAGDANNDITLWEVTRSDGK